MSRTDVHRPWTVQLADPHNRHLLYRYAEWGDEMARTSWRNLCCGRRMCTGHYDRKSQRRRERAAGRRDCRNWNEEQTVTDERIRGLRWLWHADYYDGPMAGMVTSDSTGPLWATCDDVDLHPRRFRLIRLTVEAQAEQERRHDLFRRMVGIHCDYDENGKRAGEFEQPAGWHDFYDLADTWPRWAPDGEVVGWFARGDEQGRVLDFSDMEDWELDGWVDLGQPGAVAEAERRRVGETLQNLKVQS